MKSIYLILLFFLSVPSVHAEKILVAPKGEQPECMQSFENAATPKTVSSVDLAMRIVCKQRGGHRVMHKVIDTGSSELSSIILSCIDEDPDSSVFACTFSASYEDL